MNLKVKHVNLYYLLKNYFFELIFGQFNIKTAVGCASQRLLYIEFLFRDSNRYLNLDLAYQKKDSVLLLLNKHLIVPTSIRRRRVNCPRLVTYFLEAETKRASKCPTFLTFINCPYGTYFSSYET